MDRFPRRAFLKLVGAAAGIVALSPLYSVFSKVKAETSWVSVGPLDGFTKDVPTLVKKGVSTPIIIYRQESGVTALSARCTHAGCIVGVDKGGKYVCPCHGSQFKYDGTVVRGPAKRNLDAVPVKISESGEVLVEV